MVKMSLKAMRVNADLTQQGLADATGISKAAIQSYEVGKTSPTMERLERMCAACGVSPDNIRLR